MAVVSPFLSLSKGVPRNEAGDFCQVSGNSYKSQATNCLPVTGHLPPPESLICCYLAPNPAIRSFSRRKTIASRNNSGSNGSDQSALRTKHFYGAIALIIGSIANPKVVSAWVNV